MDTQAENIKEKAVTRQFTIIVNGREKQWPKPAISFEEVVELAFGPVPPNPNIIYTVTYKGGPGERPKGTMVKGDIIKIKEGMVFNVTATDKS